MHMHMFGLMYAPSDRVTLMAMAPYIDKRMTHLQNPMMGDAVFKTTTKGIGDIKLGRWWGFWTMGDIQVHLSFPSPNSNVETFRPIIQSVRCVVQMLYF